VLVQQIGDPQQGLINLVAPILLTTWSSRRQRGFQLMNRVEKCIVLATGLLRQCLSPSLLCRRCCRWLYS
jgi:hypothetical protein